MDIFLIQLGSTQRRIFQAKENANAPEINKNSLKR